MTFNLSVYVLPRSSKTEIVGMHGGALKIKLKAPPVDGAANEELIKFLAEKLRIPKKNIKILKGQNQKRKIISISGNVDLQLIHESPKDT